MSALTFTWAILFGIVAFAACYHRATVLRDWKARTPLKKAHRYIGMTTYLGGAITAAILILRSFAKFHGLW